MFRQTHGLPVHHSSLLTKRVARASRSGWEDGVPSNIPFLPSILPGESNNTSDGVSQSRITCLWAGGPLQQHPFISLSSYSLSREMYQTNSPPRPARVSCCACVRNKESAKLCNVCGAYITNVLEDVFHGQRNDPCFRSTPRHGVGLPTGCLPVRKHSS